MSAEDKLSFEATAESQLTAVTDVDDASARVTYVRDREASGETEQTCVVPRPPDLRDCFTKADNAALTFQVFQTAGTPASTNRKVCGNASSPYYPGTDFVGGNGRAADGGGRYKSFYLHWINRCQYLRGITPKEADCKFQRNSGGDIIRVTTKGNSYEGAEVFARLQDQMRAGFSTYVKANTCSILQEMQLLNYADVDIDSRAQSVGLRVYRNPDRSKAILNKMAQEVVLADGTPWRYLVDLCVLPKKNEAEGFEGLGLDYEVNDNRSTEQTDSLIGEYAAKAHKAAKAIVLMINPLPREASGVDATNAAKLLDKVDYLILASSNGASPGNKDVGNKRYAPTRSIMQGYEQQLDVVTQNGRLRLTDRQKSHVVWMAPLYAVTLDDAKSFHDIVKREKYAGISIFRNYQTQGGACNRDVNQLTACFTLGACDGKFGLERRLPRE